MREASHAKCGKLKLLVFPESYLSRRSFMLHFRGGGGGGGGGTEPLGGETYPAGLYADNPLTLTLHMVDHLQKG